MKSLRQNLFDFKVFGVIIPVPIFLWINCQIIQLLMVTWIVPVGFIIMLFRELDENIFRVSVLGCPQRVSHMRWKSFFIYFLSGNCQKTVSFQSSLFGSSIKGIMLEPSVHNITS